MRIAIPQTAILSRTAATRAASVQPGQTEVSARTPEPAEQVTLHSSAAAPAPAAPLGAKAASLSTPEGRAEGLAYWKQRYQEFRQEKPSVRQLISGYQEATKIEDPMVRNAAERVLGRFNDSLEKHDTLAGMSQRMGEREGLDSWLARTSRGSAYKTEERAQLPAALAGLDKREGPIEEKSLRGLVSLVNRMDEKFPERAQIVDQLQTWWGQGRFEVRREGRPVLPGAVPLNDVIATYPAIEGHKVEISKEIPRSAKAEAFFAGERQPLAGLPADDRQEILQDTLAHAFEDKQSARNWERLLGEATRSDVLKADLEPMKDQLWGLYDKLEPTGGPNAKGNLDWNLYNHYRATLDMFPEDLQQHHLTDIFAPMAKNLGRGNALLKKSVEINPDFKPVALDITREMSRSQGYTHHLFSELLDEGTALTQQDLQMMADKLIDISPVSGPGRPGESAVEKWVPRLIKAQEQNPAVFDNLEAPGADYEMKPFRFAVLDGMLHDWNSEPKRWAKEELSEQDQQLFKLIGTDGPVLDYLEQKVGKLDKLEYLADSRESALVLLQRFAPERAAEAVKPALKTASFESYITEFAEPARGREIEAGLKQMNAENFGDKAFELLEIAHASRRVDTFKERSAKIFAKVEEFGGFTDEQLAALTDELKASITPGEKLESKGYVAAEILWRNDRGKDLHEFLTPHLVENRTSGAHGAGSSFMGPELVWEELQMVNEELASASSADQVWKLVARGTEPARQLKGQYTLEFFEAVAERCESQGLLPDLTNFVKNKTRSPHASLFMLRTALEHTPEHLSRGTSLDALSVLYNTHDSWDKTEREFLEKLPTIKKDEDWVGALKEHLVGKADPATENLDIEMEEDLLWVGDIPLEL